MITIGGSGKVGLANGIAPGRTVVTEGWKQDGAVFTVGYGSDGIDVTTVGYGPDGTDATTLGSGTDDTVLTVQTGPDGIAVTVGWASIAIKKK